MNNKDSKYTKIVATLGPASNNKETLSAILNAGVDVVRMNFSHGDHSTHQANLDLVRRTAKSLKKTVALLQDLGGPKIRIGDFVHGKALLKKGETFTLTTKNVAGDEKLAYINYELLPAEVKKGDSVMIFDGKIHLSVLKTTATDIVCKVLVGGEISNRKGVNVPGANLSISSLTKKDKEDVVFGIKNKVEFVALSFVRKASDVLELKSILKKAGSKALVVAKIETQEAVENIDAIIEASDAVMVARGDLAVEIGPENVPMVQKSIIKKANSLGKPVITATQMLDSMEHSATPTRAEVSDVANAIFDGTDAIMLSGETAAGEYPVESVEVMTRIALATEQSRNKRQFVNLYGSSDIVDAVTLSVVRVSESINARAIIALTESGLTARMVSRFHAPFPIIAVSPVEISCNQLVLSYGVFPVKMVLSKNIDMFTRQITDFVLKQGIAKRGEKIVLSAGMPFGKVGSTNTLFVLNI
jgi:pyruvate kinase